MNPFRYLPRMFFTVLLFGAVPILYDLTITEDPTAGIDCDHPKSQEETSVRKAGPNLGQAQKKILEGLENLKAMRE